MRWHEFCALINGLSSESALGLVIQIRAEEDPEVLKHFTKGQHKIRSEWKKRRVTKVTQKQTMDFLEQIKQAFISMAGGGNN